MLNVKKNKDTIKNKNKNYNTSETNGRDKSGLAVITGILLNDSSPP